MTRSEFIARMHASFGQCRVCSPAEQEELDDLVDQVETPAEPAPAQFVT